jgi:DNA-binding response OmpR family regulator
MDPSPVSTVLVVDDDEDVGQLMQDFLEAQGFKVLRAFDGRAALALHRDEEIDCVLLDIMMPGMSGIDVLRRLRTTSEVPVIIVSARMEDSDKIRGLGLGADDYVVKSASPSEVVARVQALLRRTRNKRTNEEVLNFGRLVIDTSAREVTVDGARVALTPKEFDLLLHLARNPRRVFSREQLIDRFWGEYGSEHSLTVHIGRIREKVEADLAKPVFISTVWGVGYRFEGKRAR